MRRWRPAGGGWHRGVGHRGVGGRHSATGADERDRAAPICARRGRTRAGDNGLGRRGGTRHPVPGGDARGRGGSRDARLQGWAKAKRPRAKRAPTLGSAGSRRRSVLVRTRAPPPRLRAPCRAGGGCGVLTLRPAAGIRVKQDKLDKFMKGDPMGACPRAAGVRARPSVAARAAACQRLGGMERSRCACPG